MDNKKEKKILKSFFHRFFNDNYNREEEQMLENLELRLLEKNQGNLFKSDFEKNVIRNRIFDSIESKIHASKFMWYKIAASIIISLGIGLGYYQFLFNDYVEYANNSDAYKNIELIDGTIITLNKNSILMVSDDFNESERNVSLKGEAFFDVSRDEKRPFVISTGKLKTQVLGTSFNIKQTNTDVKVSVATGLVKVFDSENEVEIRPNQQAVYCMNDRSVKKREINIMVSTTWFKKTFSLEGITLEEFQEFAMSRFETKIQFEDEDLKNKRLSIIVNECTTLENIMKQINFINEVKLTKTGTNMIKIEDVK